jgi:hypothetical protein
LEGVIVTPQRKAHFAQVPLAAIKKIVEEEARQRKIKADEEALVSKKKDEEPNLLETTIAHGWSGRK